MTVTAVHRDPEQLTMTIHSHFDAATGRVWALWDNPRLLERWWGPPTYPATFIDHDLRPGGHVSYFMTGPEGDKHHGWWRITAVDAPNRLEFEDGFGDDAGNPAEGMPTITVAVTLSSEAGSGTRMTVESRFPSKEAMEQLMSMGMEEGITAAIGQIDDLLAEPGG